VGWRSGTGIVRLIAPSNHRLWVQQCLGSRNRFDPRHSGGTAAGLPWARRDQNVEPASAGFRGRKVIDRPLRLSQDGETPGGLLAEDANGIPLMFSKNDDGTLRIEHFPDAEAATSRRALFGGPSRVTSSVPWRTRPSRDASAHREALIL
jgi:hypothetical protein